MLPLPDALPSTDLVLPLHADTQAFVRFDTNRYSVGSDYAAQALTLVADDQSVRVLDGQREIASHPRCFGRGQILEQSAHREALVRQRRAGLFALRQPRSRPALQHHRPQTRTAQHGDHHEFSLQTMGDRVSRRRLRRRPRRPFRSTLSPGRHRRRLLARQALPRPRRAAVRSTALIASGQAALEVRCSGRLDCHFSTQRGGRLHARAYPLSDEPDSSAIFTPNPVCLPPKCGAYCPTGRNGILGWRLGRAALRLLVTAGWAARPQVPAGTAPAEEARGVGAPGRGEGSQRARLVYCEGLSARLRFFCTYMSSSARTISCAKERTASGSYWTAPTLMART